MFYYLNDTVKIATLVVYPTEDTKHHINYSSCNEFFMSRAFENFWSDPDNWIIDRLLETSSLHSLLLFNNYVDKDNSYNMSLDDYLSTDDDNLYIEIPVALWYVLKDRTKLFKNKNVILSHSAECFIPGIKCSQQKFPDKIKFQDNILSDLSVCKNAIVAIDNIDPRNQIRFPFINWIPTNVWLCEYHYKLQNKPHIRDSITFNNLKIKKHKFVALLGKRKPHRTNFADIIIENNLVDNNVIGTNMPGEMYRDLFPKYESKNNEWGPVSDREMKIEWLTKCKLWISFETVYDDLDIQENEMVYSQLTEKTFKPMAYGMPFLLHGGLNCIEHLNSLGFKTFIDIFGDYRGKTYIETNKNILDVIQKCDTYDWNKIAEYCVHNHDTLLKYDSKTVTELFFKNLLNVI